MAFMTPETYNGTYLVIDGPQGTDYIPCDVADIDDKALAVWNARRENEGEDAIPACLADYTENKTAYSIERHKGLLSRLSARGYMDSTGWEPGGESELCESWDICEECYENCWEQHDKCPGCNVAYPDDFDGCRAHGCPACSDE